MSGGDLAPVSPLDRRRLGALLHPTSLPGPGEIGTLGPGALHFIDFMRYAGLSVWQALPLGPTHEDRSPYQCTSAHAGNPRLISLEGLQAKGWLKTPDFDGHQAGLVQAYANFQAQAKAHEQAALIEFVRQQATWLPDFSLFSALKQRYEGAPWWQWPALLRDRDSTALAEARKALAAEIAQVQFEQFVFATQWQEIKHYANERDILLFGDIPIFVALDSADVWAERHYFLLDETGQPTVVAGVPPDYFSATGQLWGNPHYHWERMAADDFAWWQRRIASQLTQFDLIRIDHFRGFEACWTIPAAERTAIKGQWVPAPGAQLFASLIATFGRLPLVAEDLGVITAEVEALRDQFGLPGMKILQFAFGGGADNPYLPHNHIENAVVYTGTHDNDTTLGWYEALPEAERQRLLDYLGYPEEPMPWPLIREAMRSVARLAIVPMQDLMGLGTEARMNTPGSLHERNWGWRFEWEDIPQDTVERLRHLVQLYGRE